MQNETSGRSNVLGNLTIRFVASLMKNKRVDRLEDVAELCTQDDATAGSTFQTRLKRLYDIGNFLCTLGLANKVFDQPRTASGHRKPSFVWVGTLAHIPGLEHARVDPHADTPERRHLALYTNGLTHPPEAALDDWLQHTGAEGQRLLLQCKQDACAGGMHSTTAHLAYERLFVDVMRFVLNRDQQEGAAHSEEQDHGPTPTHAGSAAVRTPSTTSTAQSAVAAARGSVCSPTQDVTSPAVANPSAPIATTTTATKTTATFTSAHDHSVCSPRIPVQSASLLSTQSEARPALGFSVPRSSAAVADEVAESDEEDDQADDPHGGGDDLCDDKLAGSQGAQQLSQTSTISNASDTAMSQRSQAEADRSAAASSHTRASLLTGAICAPTGPARTVPARHSAFTLASTSTATLSAAAAAASARSNTNSSSNSNSSSHVTGRDVRLAFASPGVGMHEASFNAVPTPSSSSSVPTATGAAGVVDGVLGGDDDDDDTGGLHPVSSPGYQGGYDSHDEDEREQIHSSPRAMPRVILHPDDDNDAGNNNKNNSDDDDDDGGDGGVAAGHAAAGADELPAKRSKRLGASFVPTNNNDNNSSSSSAKDVDAGAGAHKGAALAGLLCASDDMSPQEVAAQSVTLRTKDGRMFLDVRLPASPTASAVPRNRDDEVAADGGGGDGSVVRFEVTGQPMLLAEGL